MFQLAGRRAFNLSADFARQTRCWRPTGLYNGFLAAGGMGLWLGRRGCRWLSFSGLRAGRRDFRRADRQPQNSLYSGAAALLALVAVLTQA